jgi:hypothetical protein
MVGHIFAAVWVGTGKDECREMFSAHPFAKGVEPLVDGFHICFLRLGFYGEDRKYFLKGIESASSKLFSIH